MFGSVGPTEIILIFIIALLVFGPKKLPEIGKSVGKAIREFKKASDEIKGRIEEEIKASEIKDIGKDIKDEVQGLRDEIKKEIPTSPLEDLKKELESGAKILRDDLTKDDVSHETGEGTKISG
jgi:TatA/E family protein of Tat protein translocase